MNIYCPVQEETARLCYDRLSNPNPLVKHCDATFTEPSEPCPFTTSVSSVKFVEDGLCITQGMDASLCAEMGMGIAYTFTGSACVGVDLGQEDCVTRESEGSTYEDMSFTSEEMSFSIPPGHKLCLTNIGVSCGTGFPYHGHTHIAIALAQESCPVDQNVARDLPDCYADVVVDDEPDDDCFVIPEGSECFILEKTDRTATLYCDGDCKTTELETVLNFVIKAAANHVDRIVSEFDILDNIMGPWSGGNKKDRSVVPDDWNIGNCDWRARIDLGYNSHPIEAWIDPSGYNINEDTYHPGHAVHYCVWQSVESGAYMRNLRRSLLMASLGFALFYL